MGRNRSVSELSRAQMKIIAENYASTSNEISGGIISKQYELSKGTLGRLLKKVVIEHIVTEEVAMKIAIKSAENAEVHGGVGAYTRVINAYHRYLKERRTFRFDRNTEAELVTEYANSPVSPKDFWESHTMDRLLFNRTLVFAIIESIVDDDTVKLLKEKAKLYNPPEKIEEYFNSLILERDTMKARGGVKKVSKQRCKRPSDTKKRRNRRKNQLLKDQKESEYEQMKIDFDLDGDGNS